MRNSKKDTVLVFLSLAIVVGGFFIYGNLDNQIAVIKISSLLAAFVAAGFVFYQTTYGYTAWKIFKGARGEFKRIVWPPKNQAGVTTLIVFIVVFLVALYLWGIDTVLFRVIRTFLGVY